MTVIRDIRQRCQHFIFPALGACVLAYFAYHTVQGDRGLLSFMRLDKEVNRAQESLHGLRDERFILEHRVGLLDRHSLDLDMLEERLRLDLHKLQSDEVVIFLPSQN